ncbi:MULTISPECIES: YkvI family membrane protein [unclassified Sedimentibacter]|uniref:YkvI family membrane protein n=1 Tax=unclassified Sedimentibacter TaxID=2649220 RepID=UPI0027E0CDB1|nr:hypothetical protein [Sedimentibacter sp. MB35-C1]WMJ76770.1 hypothetical protein RBQ61_14510 [Sedimentibacter sp. MB35-C1]
MDINLGDKENITQKKRKSIVPTFIGIAAVWFGTHVGPGVASGKQVVSYYAAYGKLGIFTPIIAMSLLALAIYFALEYSRVNKIHDFKTFTNKFFHPYEKLFSTFFEICFLVTCLLAPGLCIATSAKLLEQFFGLSMWTGTIILVIVSVALVIYGAELVKAASTGLTLGILVILAIIVTLGIKLSSGTIASNWASTSFSDFHIVGGIWIAISYAGFQSTGIIGNCISVSEGLDSRKDSMKAAVLGTVLNGLMLAFIALVNYGFQPESINSLLPNFYIVQQLGMPVLESVYVLFVVMASVSTIITFAFSLVVRFGGKQILVRNIKSERSRNLFIVLVMLILDVIVASFGIAQIINVGYKYLGYFSIFVVMFPFIVVGIKRNKEMKLLNK